MSDWKESSLQDITIFIKDGTHGTHNDVVDGIPLLSAKDIENGKVSIPDDCRMVSESDYKQLHSSYEIQNDDILLTVVGTIGRVAIAKKLNRKITFQRSVSIIRFDRTKILPEYSYYYFHSNKFQQALERSMNASAQGGVYLGELAKIKINYPQKFETQQKIARILTTCDTVIEHTQATIEKYKAIKQGMLHDLFTRGLDANDKLRPTPQQAPERYKNSEMGLIPKEWEVKRIGILFKFNQGLQCPVEKQKLVKVDIDDVRFIRIIDLTNKNEPIRYITNPGSQYIICKSDLFMVRYGVPGLIGFDYEGVIANNLFRLLVKDDFQISPLFYYYYLSSLQEKFLSLSGSSTMPAINFSTLNKLNLIYPYFNEQIEIANRIKVIDTKLQSEETLFAKYQSIKKGLMKDLLSGKRPLTPPDKISG